MSRVQLKSLPEGTIEVGGTFAPAVGAQVYVYAHDPNSTAWGGTNAPVPVVVYSTELGTGVLSQPLYADVNGQLPGWVNAEQVLDIVATYQGVQSAPIEAEVVGGSDVQQLAVITLESLGSGVGSGSASADSAAFQAAANLGRAYIKGKSGASYQLNELISLYTDASHNAQGQVWDMRGCTITTSVIGGGILQDSSVADGTTFRKGFTLLGGTWVGSGLRAWVGGNQIFENALYLQQWTDVVVIGGDYSSFTSGALSFRLCGRVMVDHTVLHDICVTNGENGIDIIDGRGGSATGESLEGQFTLTNNVAYPGATGIPTVHISLNALYGNYSNLDAVITGNNSIVNGASAMYYEINSYNAGAGDSVLSRTLMTGNSFVNLSTSAGATACSITDDGPNPVNDPLKMANHVIEGNHFACASNATQNNGQAVLDAQVSRASIRGNRIRALGTNGLCFATPSPGSTDATVTQDLSFEGNDLIQENAAATSRIAQFFKTTGLTIKGGSVKSKATTSGATDGHGIYIDSTCSNVAIGGDIEVDGTLNCGLYLGNVNGLRVGRITVRNANATAQGTGHDSASGIWINGTPAGALILLDGPIDVIDDRGSHLCRVGLTLNGTISSKPHLGTFKCFGMLEDAFNGGSISSYASIQRVDSDIFDRFPATANTAGASPFTTAAQPYDQQLILSTVGGMTAFTYSRNSIALPQVAGSHVLIRRGETVTMTWATTPPTFALIPMV